MRVGVTLTTLDERLRELWEPGAAGVDKRCRVIAEARRTGLETSVMFGPLLPFLSDGQAEIDGLLRRAGDLEVDTIWVDALNPRPRVWPAVADLLRVEFPDLLPRYQKILFDRTSRADYLGELRARVDRAARRAAVSDRVGTCMWMMVIAGRCETASGLASHQPRRSRAFCNGASVCSSSIHIVQTKNTVSDVTTIVRVHFQRGVKRRLRHKNGNASGPSTKNSSGRMTQGLSHAADWLVPLATPSWTARRRRHAAAAAVVVVGAERGGALAAKWARLVSFVHRWRVLQCQRHGAIMKCGRSVPAGRG